MCDVLCKFVASNFLLLDGHGVGITFNCQVRNVHFRKFALEHPLLDYLPQ